jgi:hypothetical protein
MHIEHTCRSNATAKKMEATDVVPSRKEEGRSDSEPLVRKRTIPTELPQLVGEVSANFCW